MNVSRPSIAYLGPRSMDTFVILTTQQSHLPTFNSNLPGTFRHVLITFSYKSTPITLVSNISTLEYNEVKSNNIKCFRDEFSLIDFPLLQFGLRCRIKFSNNTYTVTCKKCSRP